MTAHKNKRQHNSRRGVRERTYTDHKLSVQHILLLRDISNNSPAKMLPGTTIPKLLDAKLIETVREPTKSNRTGTYQMTTAGVKALGDARKQGAI